MILASIIIAALRRNSELTIFDLDMITCPTTSCVATPERCSKGQKQICKKKIDVVYEYNGHNNVAVIVFYYQHPNIPQEGFVRKDDLTLNKLLV